jgi:hypothetical protein
VLILLRQRHAAIRGVELATRTAYLAAFRMAQMTPEDPGIALRPMFGDDLVFELAPEGNVVLRFDNKVVIDLPSVEASVEGPLSYPSRFADLLTQRQRIAERLADYDFFRVEGLADDETVYLAELAARASRMILPPEGGGRPGDPGARDPGVLASVSAYLPDRQDVTTAMIATALPASSAVFSGNHDRSC